MHKKLLILAALGTVLTACTEVKKDAPVVGDTYNPQMQSKVGTYDVIENGKRKVLVTETDIDVVSKDVCFHCEEGFPKEVAILTANSALEVRVGDYSPNITLENVRTHCVGDNHDVIDVYVDFKAAHPGGEKANLPSIEMPIFVAAVNLATQEVLERVHGMVKVDMNNPYDIQTAKLTFNMADLKARNIKDWSLVTGIMLSEQNRKYMGDVQRSKQHAIAEGKISGVANVAYPQAVRGSDDAAPFETSQITK